jgi:hypothetical protein
MFDPYLTWLGIPPEQRPLNCYQLLGIAADVQDANVIQEAAIQRTMQVRPYQTGPHAEDCTRLLNEIAEAQTTLLDPVKRKEYDISLARYQGGPAKYPTAQPAPPAAIPVPVKAALPREPAPSKGFPVAVGVAPPASKAPEPAGASLAVASTVAPQEVEPVRHRRRRRLWPWLLALECVLCLAIGAVLAFWHLQSDSEFPAPPTGPTADLSAPAPPTTPRLVEPTEPATRPPKVVKNQQPFETRPDPAPQARPAERFGEFRPPPKQAYAPEARAAPKHRPGGAYRPPPRTDHRAPIPDIKSQDRAEKFIHEVYQAEFAKKKPAELMALSATLLQQARETKDEPASRYVLLREAGRQAARAGNPSPALAAIDEMARDYTLSPGFVLERKVDALDMVASALHAASPYRSIVETMLNVVDEAVAADHLDMATRVLTAADAVAKQFKATGLSAAVAARGREIDALRKDLKAAESARQALGKNPDDPQANLLLGRYLCLTRGDWTKGLPHLARGSHPRLKQLAEFDLGEPLLEADQMALADSWWALAEAETGPARARLQERACYWYEQTYPAQAGLSRTKIEKRFEALAAALPPAATPISFSTLRDWREVGDVKNAADWSLKNGKLAGGKESVFWLQPYFSSGEFWVSLVFFTGPDAPALAFAPDAVHGHGGFWLIEVTPDRQLRLRRFGLPEMFVVGGVKVDAGRRVLSVRLGGQEIVVFVDGRQKLRYRLDPDLPPPRRVGLYTETGAVAADSIAFGSNHTAGPRFDIAPEYPAFEGRWIVKFSNQKIAEYLIDAMGNVRDGTRLGIISKKAADVVAEFGDGSLERLKLVSGQLQLQLFPSAAVYPAKPSASGVGIKK